MNPGSGGFDISSLTRHSTSSSSASSAAGSSHHPVHGSSFLHHPHQVTPGGIHGAPHPPHSTHPHAAAATSHVHPALHHPHHPAAYAGHHLAGLNAMSHPHPITGHLHPGVAGTHMNPGHGVLPSSIPGLVHPLLQPSSSSAAASVVSQHPSAHHSVVHHPHLQSHHHQQQMQHHQAAAAHQLMTAAAAGHHQVVSGHHGSSSHHSSSGHHSSHHSSSHGPNPIPGVSGVPPGVPIVPQVQSPVSQVPPPVAPPPVMSEATNALASSINLSSIQSLVDLLVELPLPSEGGSGEFPMVNSRDDLITELQSSTHASCLNSSSLDFQHVLSSSVAPPLVSAKQQMSQMNLQFVNSSSNKSSSNKQLNNGSGSDHQTSSSVAKNDKNSNNSNHVIVSVNNSNSSQGPVFSDHLNQNSYLLSLLQSLESFFDNSNVQLPIQHQHQPMPTGPQTRSQQQQQQQQQQYWNPWSSGADAVQQQSSSAAAAASVPQITSSSPYHVSSSPSSRQQIPAAVTSAAYGSSSSASTGVQSSYSNSNNSMNLAAENSNSSSHSSYSESQHNATPASGASGIQSPAGSNQRLHQTSHMSSSGGYPAPASNHSVSSPATPHVRQQTPPHHNQQQQPQLMQQQPVKSSPSSGGMGQQLQQGSYGGMTASDVSKMQFVDRNPVILLDKIQVDQSLLDYYNFSNNNNNSSSDITLNGPCDEIDPYAPSLADRVKSNKRQRDEQKESKRESKHSSKSSKDHQERPSKSRQAEDENTVLTSNTRQVVCNTNQKSSSKMRDEVRVPKVHKSSSSSQVKTSSSSGGNNYISSSYLSASSSSSKPQLTSQSLSLPPPEKLEAMMDELFDLNKIGSGGHHHQSSSKHHKNHKKGSDGDSTEDEDDEDQLQQDHYDHSDEDSDGGRRRKRLKKSCKSSKKSGAKTNGDLQSEMAIFDITLSESTLTTFVSLTAKLKRSNQTSGATASKISSLLTVLTQQISIQSAGLKDRRRRSSVDDSNQSDEDQDEDSGNITTSQSLMHKFESCCDCCLVALYILSSRGMSSRVYLEECIEAIIAFLNTTIQQFTTIGSAASGSGSVSPSKGNKKSPKKISNSYISPTIGANKKILAKVYTKWSEMIGLLDELLTLRSGSLTDTLVLSTTRLALGAFFLENLSSGSSYNSSLLSSSSDSNEIQLNALKLTTTIFSQYSGHRGVILDELLSSIARLPTSKRGRVIYKVQDGSDENISMFTALLQQLIQSLFRKKRTCEDLDPGDDHPDPDDPSHLNNNPNSGDLRRKGAADSKNLAQTLKSQYDAALRVSYTFLSAFLRKCCGLSVGGQSASDVDYRVLFEGLVSDLMATLHKPNWPAAQLLTQVLVKILITNITPAPVTHGTHKNQPKGNPGGGSGGASAQLNLKLASLDHLGTICSRFAKELSDVDGVKCEVKKSLNSILNGDNTQNTPGCHDRKSSLLSNDDTEEDEAAVPKPSKAKQKRKRHMTRKTAKDDFLVNDETLLKEIWKHLIRFCDEESLLDEKNLLVSVWLREMDIESKTLSKTDKDSEEDEDESSPAKLSQRELLDQKVKFFMGLYQTAATQSLDEDEYHVIDGKTAGLIIRFLDISSQTTVKLFDAALGHIIAALSSTSNTMMRSRAMKSLSTILNNAHRRNATALLARADLQRAMRTALLDTSTSVREATIDLIGKFILSGNSEDLIDKYYDIMTDRVLDAGVSVRKRVIKILREICTTYPSYRRVPEICSKIIKRINDDGEGIRKLVTETFTQMWFKEDKDRESTRLKVACMNHVVATVLTERIGTEWLQQLLTNLFAAGDTSKKKTVTEINDEEEDRPAPSLQQLQQVTSASSQIIDVLISEILCGEQQPPASDSASSKQQIKYSVLSAVTTIWLFGKVSPNLLMDHVSTLQPYLSIKCTTQLDMMVLSKVAQILELVMPKLSNPSESLLNSIEEDLTKNILSNNAAVLGYCVSCLSTIIHRHTNNRKLAQDLFSKFFTVLTFYSRSPELLRDPTEGAKNRGKFLRALFVCGLFAKHFEFLQEKQQLFQILIQIIRDHQATIDHPNGRDADILSKSLTGLGFALERNPHYCLDPNTQEIYKNMLHSSYGDLSFAGGTGIQTGIQLQQQRCSRTYQELVQCQVLRNLTNYLSDEFNQEMSFKVEWSKENLKCMSSDEGDSNSLQSTIIQSYLNDVLGCTLSPILNVRRAAVNLVHIIHNGGFQHPLQLVPYLIAMSSDDDTNIRLRADHVLNEIERKYHGFVSMKSKIGVHLAYQLHSHSGRRGYRIEHTNLSSAKDGGASGGSTDGSSKSSKSSETSSGGSTSSGESKIVTGRLSTLYSVVSGNRQSRRAFVSGLLKYFDVMAGSGAASYNDVMTHVNTDVTRGGEPTDLSSVQQFVCDNIVWLPYNLWDEPLYILQQLELNLSLLASHILSQFKEALQLTDDDEDEMEAEELRKQEPAAQAPVASSKNNRNQVSRVYHDDDTEDEEEAEGDLDDDDERRRIRKEQKGAAQEGSGFYSDLKSYLPKPLPPLLLTVDLVKGLRAYYMLFWVKQLLRELFSIQDAKIQDYSPNENQKVWDKPIHRRDINVRMLDTLMAYPPVLIDMEKVAGDRLRDLLLKEYKRFKNVQVTGVDSVQKAVAQILKDPIVSFKSAAAQKEYQHPSSSSEAALQYSSSSGTGTPSRYNNYSYVDQPAPHSSMDSLPSLSKDLEEELIQKIRKQTQECTVSLPNISSVDIKKLMDKHQLAQPVLSMSALAPVATPAGGLAGGGSHHYDQQTSGPVVELHHQQQLPQLPPQPEATTGQKQGQQQQATAVPSLKMTISINNSLQSGLSGGLSDKKRKKKKKEKKKKKKKHHHHHRNHRDYDSDEDDEDSLPSDPDDEDSEYNDAAADPD